MQHYELQHIFELNEKIDTKEVTQRSYDQAKHFFINREIVNSTFLFSLSDDKILVNHSFQLKKIKRKKKEKVFTIEDLANGKCAVVNDGSLWQLNKVLKLSFPKDERVIIMENCKYYFQSSIKHTWVGNNATTLPTQSVTKFLK